MFRLFCFVTTVCVLFRLFLPFFYFFGMSLFPSTLVPLPLPLCMESTLYLVRFFLPDGVFVPRDHGLDGDF